MAAKQSQPVKRPVPLEGRSVMLTRFKLSQLKRQLREKERKTSEPKSSPQKADDKKVKGKGSLKNKREKEGFHPSKLKKKIAAKKIVLESTHELKVIEADGSCKRKINLQQKGPKSPPAKRLRSRNYPDPSELDRSQSPIYSELGFEEVIRMVDENHILDDDDLLEILTCPSPVWWEDPPDEEYVEGPIDTESSKKSTSPPSFKQVRCKASRKTTPHKLILEPENTTKTNNHGDKADTVNIIDDATFKDINKTDDRFKNKRSKLESLLSVLKDKKNQPKSQNDNISKNDGDLKENRKDYNDTADLKPINNRTSTNTSKEESETELDDITFAAISQQDKDSLKYLENIEIPMEVISADLVNEIAAKPAAIIKKKPLNPNDTIKVIKKPKPVPSYDPNKTWKIVNIKSMIPNPLIPRKHAQMKILPSKSTLKDHREYLPKLQNRNKYKIIDLNNVKVKINGNNDKEKEDKDIPYKFHSQHLIVNDKMEDIKRASKEPPIIDDFATITKIVPCITDKIEADHLGEEITEQSKPDNEPTDKEAKTLDSYYKKCKGTKKDLKSNFKDNAEVREHAIGKEDLVKEEEAELCDSCDKDVKKSIIVPTTTDVKYCLKCSCIFDKQECDYCIMNERLTTKIQEQHIEAKSDEIVNGVDSLPNQNNLIET